ncbi:MAG TPA: GntR family transcriptional regulator [Clostridia bacterium]|jgi:GntR family transcriptional regulator|nr:GntR family transcriptional regulator [Clostridiaceae bacterium]HOA31967.1 GntR family transcriptional regulator [Clostridia bacterium]HPZ53352.1 GntR family transcriptional regulator [Clostridia bacterium]
MFIEFSDEKPIFIQIAEWIEDAILAGRYEEEQQIPSITEFSVACKINPATALKGINLLVDDGILYKKRGLGMFVANGAHEKLRTKRKELFYENYVISLVKEAKRINIDKNDIMKMIERGFEND